MQVDKRTNNTIFACFKWYFIELDIYYSGIVLSHMYFVKSCLDKYWYYYETQQKEYMKDLDGETKKIIKCLADPEIEDLNDD